MSEINEKSTQHSSEGVSSSENSISDESHAQLNDEIPIPILKPKWLHPVGHAVRKVRVAPDSSTVAFATEEGAMKVLETQKGEVLFDFPSQDSFFGASDLQYSPDGAYLALALENGRLCLFDLSKKELVFQNSELGESPENLRWSRDSQNLFFILGKKILRWTLLSEGVEESELVEEETTITDLGWVDGKMLAYTTYSHMKVIESHTARIRQDFSWKGSLLSLEICPNKKYAVCGTQDKTIHIWNLSTKKDMEMRGFESKIRQVSFREDGLSMAHGTGNEVIVWDFSGTGPSGKKPQVLGPFETEVVEVHYQNEGNILCSAGKDGILLFWNPLETQQPLAISGIRDQEVASFAWSGDDSFLVVGFVPGYVTLIPWIKP